MQNVRVQRAKDQDIRCETLECQDDGFVFIVAGETGERYIVEIAEDVENWPPKCSCPDNEHRPFLCKHLCYCLYLMGLDESEFESLYYDPPDQSYMYELLSNAPRVVDSLDWQMQ